MRVFFSLMVIATLAFGNFGCSGSSSNQPAPETDTNNNKSINYADDMDTFDKIIKSNKPVLVDFYADWCAPCRMMAPILEQVAGNMKGEVKILKVNVDKNREAAMKYGIRSIPTLILFQNGEIKWQGTGVLQADQIEQIVNTKSKVKL
jgi:thioredoxin 1